jgi:hypothetical protein
VCPPVLELNSPKEHWAQSGFANTDLDMQLTQRGVQKIMRLFSGL